MCLRTFALLFRHLERSPLSYPRLMISLPGRWWGGLCPNDCSIISPLNGIFSSGRSPLHGVIYRSSHQNVSSLWTGRCLWSPFHPWHLEQYLTRKCSMSVISEQIVSIRWMIHLGSASMCYREPHDLSSGHFSIPSIPPARPYTHICQPMNRYKHSRPIQTDTLTEHTETSMMRETYIPIRRHHTCMSMHTSILVDPYPGLPGWTHTHAHTHTLSIG